MVTEIADPAILQEHNAIFGLRVKRGYRFVQDQHAAIVLQTTRNAKQLLLP